ncbi:hypothetical protein [Streptomyces sp. NPDC097981]|uniref:hypothetical protein n=1 Tax=Streptomyces sp. NPDC097981 TaxID=3155428 RepID=UPI00331FDAB9
MSKIRGQGPNNSSTFDTGGIFNYTGSTLTLNHSTVSGNTATTNAGGILNTGGSLTLDHSTVSGNTAGQDGGGIFNDGGGTTALTSSTVVRNTANGGPVSGGGIFNASGTVTLDGSRVRNNIPDNCAPENTISGCTN